MAYRNLTAGYRVTPQHVLTESEIMSILTSRAVLAHEYYGHYKYRKTRLFPGDWRDEFRASYRAALDTPNLTIEERASLMIDAYDRAEEAGCILRKTADNHRILYGF